MAIPTNKPRLAWHKRIAFNLVMLASVWGIIINYMFSLGAEFDIVINLDGLRSIAARIKREIAP